MTGFAPAYAPSFAPPRAQNHISCSKCKRRKTVIWTLEGPKVGNCACTALGQNGNGRTSVTTAEGAVGLLGLISFMGSFVSPKPYKAVLFTGGIAGMAAAAFSAGQRALG